MNTISYDKFSLLMAQNSYKKDIPVNGTFELTPLCNLDCKMCYVHLQDPSVKNRMLTGKQWISFMKDAISQGMTTALLTGGEAMTHPDFREIYMFLINSGVITRIKTNGILLNEENIALFTQYPPYLIDVSLYGCDSESYLAVTGSDVFEIVTGNIRAAIAAGLHLRIMITPSSYMSLWTEQTMELANTFEVPVVVNSMLIEPNNGTGRKKEDFTLAETENEKIMQKKEELFPPKLLTKEEEDELFSLVEEIAEGRSDVSEKGLFCNSGRTYFALNWDGTMSPCLNFPRAIVCFDALRLGFSKAWREVNEGIKNYSVPEKCHSCEVNTKCHYCPIQHSKVSAEHQCDPAVCAHWLKTYKNP